MDIILRYPGFRPKALTLSYDDAPTSDVKMIGILDKYGVKCTFNINTGCFSETETEYPEGKWGRMTKKQALDLYTGSAHEVAVHTVHHLWMTAIPNSASVVEILDDKREIEKMFGTIVRGGAYPYGAANDDICDALRLCGLAYFRTTVSTESFNVPENWLRLPATCHHRNPRLYELADKFLDGTFRYPALFYLWGHSYEFERDGNWDVLERFCEKTAGREDVWYATNAEIFDYITAYKNLRFSADHDVVCNPSATAVYLTVNGKDHVVGGGETLAIK